VTTEVLRAVEGNAVDAAIEAATRVAERREQRRQARSLELEEARYEAHLAARRNEAVDPTIAWMRPGWKRGVTKRCKLWLNWSCALRKDEHDARSFSPIPGDARTAWARSSRSIGSQPATAN
jgi:hypothetical protein